MTSPKAIDSYSRCAGCPEGVKVEPLYFNLGFRVWGGGYVQNSGREPMTVSCAPGQGSPKPPLSEGEEGGRMDALIGNAALGAVRGGDLGWVRVHKKSVVWESVYS